MFPVGYRISINISETVLKHFIGCLCLCICHVSVEEHFLRGPLQKALNGIIWLFARINMKRTLTITPPRPKLTHPTTPYPTRLTIPYNATTPAPDPLRTNIAFLRPDSFFPIGAQYVITCFQFYDLHQVVFFFRKMVMIYLFFKMALNCHRNLTNKTPNRSQITKPKHFTLNRSYLHILVTTFLN